MDEVPATLAAIEKAYPDATIEHIDGVSVDYPNWHFNVRASNTEPLLRLNLEAETPAMMEEKRDEVLAIIRGR
jgi:phosphomannomutase